MEKIEEVKVDVDPGNSVCGGSSRGSRSCIDKSDASSSWATNSKLGMRGSSAATKDQDAWVMEVRRGRGGKEEEEEEKEEEEEEEKEEEEEDDKCVVDAPHNSRAPDGGWGWMVALGTFIIHTLFFSMPFCFGILFSGFLLDNGASSTTTAWIYNLHLVLWNLSLILTNPLCQEFGQRTVGSISVLMASLSLILSGFSPCTSFLYFSFSLIGGVSTGLSLGLAYMVLPPYFNKKSGQANTFLVAGGAVTQILLAPLIRYLLEVYSLKGAALIHSGIILNGLIAVSFFHPVKWHLRPSPREKQHPQQNMSQTLMHSKAASPTTSSMTPQSEVCYLMPQNRSVQKLRTSLSGSIWSVMSAESDVLAGLAFLSDETGTSTADMENRRANALWRTLLRVAERIKSDVTVLRQFRCVILAITETLTQTTLFNFIMMLPFVAKAADQSLEDAASCISLLGVTSLVTRLVVSPLSDCKWFSIRFSLMFGFFLKAAGIIVAALSSRLWQFMASGMVFGLGLGSSRSMFNLVIVHYMGMENLRPTIGIIGLVAAIGFPTLGPLIGVIRDTTGSFSTSLYVLAALDMLSVCLWFLMPLAQARDSKM